MKNIFKLCLLLVLFVSCNNRNKNVVTPEVDKDISYNKAYYLIEELKQFELKNNRDFYNTLLIASDKYYNDVTNSFLEKEYSISGSFTEMNIIKNKMTETSHGQFTLAKKGADILINDLMLSTSNSLKDIIESNDSISTKNNIDIVGFSQTNDDLTILINTTNEARFLIWEARINNYFSSLAYSRFIKSITDTLSQNINKQRSKELEDILGFVNNDTLQIEKVNFDIFEATKEVVNQSIVEANKKIKENLKEIAYNTAEAASLVVSGGASGAVIGSVETLGVTEVVYDFVVPTKNETKEILIKEYSSFLERNNIDFTQMLNDNTNSYYSNLLELIKERENEQLYY
ncbi:hypothetical protein [Winogradskyella thalassocola]|uniref:Lipoprotein n=1 Tax=Winogradskyella thalassocola TaxID=262004 RepID=A0A1G7ZPP3_9FLAO|nr:hypothetical protein [Winogradskyella thalassocola]SDH10547.1 hypothetical protein SAMN04489796_1011397 [Winogradskyella thalassocola]